MVSPLALLLWAAPAAAQPAGEAAPQAPAQRASIGFSNLIVRIEGNDEIGMAAADLRVQILERLRERGFNAVGAENLVFDKDESHRATFRLGGTIRELACRRRGELLRCRLGVDWQLLDVERDAVVYTALTRIVALDFSANDRRRMPSWLLLGALDSLLTREKFRALLAQAPEPPARRSFAPATFARCGPSAKSMPAAADGVLNATALIRTGKGFGSGFFLTADGLLLTAAHVVDSPEVKLRLRDGTELAAAPIRVARDLDVALLRPVQPLSGRPCLAPNTALPSVGAEVYAAGAPADEKLAFSMSRGIVSGIRLLEGARKVQTDASVSPGNSGGPLIDTSGSVIALITSKFVARKVEGIAFGAPLQDVLGALALTAGTSTDPGLLTAPAELPAPLPPPIVDAPDELPSLTPEDDYARYQEEKEADEARLKEQERAEQARLEAWRRAERNRRTPTYVKAMLWGGLGLAGAGGIAALASYGRYDRDTTPQPEFRTLTTINTLGWGAFGLGAASTLVALGLRPSLPPASASPAARAAFVVGPGGVSIGGQF